MSRNELIRLYTILIHQFLGFVPTRLMLNIDKKQGFRQTTPISVSDEPTCNSPVLPNIDDYQPIVFARLVGNISDKRIKLVLL